MRKIFLPVLTLIICVGIIWKWTSGFKAFTVFSYTLYNAGPVPRAFPDIAMINQNNKIFDIKDNPKYKLVNFVYLDCPYACHKVINKLDGVYKAINNRLIPSELQFYTISFDLKDDNTQRLKNYRESLGIHQGWTFGLPYHIKKEEFEKYLKKVGIWKYQIPGTGLINHSLYVFLVSPDNKIIEVFDPAKEDDNTIAEKVQSCVNGRRIAYTY